ncbi:MAG TPA: hypothetical protein VNW06_11230, partial [Cytophagaceae bacterium]|nr:hypothetical protein [Cytophagaceae bacterium]
MEEPITKEKEEIIFKTNFNIPISLQEFDQLLIHNGYINEARYHIDKFYYLIHKLNQAHQEDKSLKEDAFVQLHSEILEILFGKDYYKNILTVLKHLGIIEEEPSYQVGVKCKGYRLTEQYKDQPSSYVEKTGTEGSFIKKLLEFYKNKTKKFFYKQEYKAAYLNLTSVAFDEQKVLQVLKEKCKELCIDGGILPATLCSLTLEQAKNDLLTRKKELPGAVKLAYWMSSVIRVLRKEWQFSVDEKGFRVHTNITNMPKELRECILLNDTNDLVEIDIPASQLLFLAVKLKNMLGIEHKVHRDLVKFLIKTVKEDIYTSIGEELHLFPEEVTQEERKKIRDEVKQDVFQSILFGKTYKNEYSLYFQKKYPTIYNYIKKLKQNDYRHSSIVLQKEESSFIFGTVIKNLIKYNPDLYFLTVHDSIIIKRVDLALVYDTMTRLFFKKYGENIKPKITYYIKENEPAHFQEPELDSMEETLLLLRRKHRKKEI